MGNWDEISGAEVHLATHFQGLCDGRDGPVFFIEHGLSEADAEDLRKTVRATARFHPLQTVWWRQYPLPLLVTATEIGYAYRGTGTDFWPRFESALGTHISPEGRQGVRDLFELCSDRYRGARPPVTPWTTAFRLIAWPITHSLIPLEFHRQLSATLARLQSDVRSVDDESLHRSFRIAARNPSARFKSFLEDGSHSVPVIRALLGACTGEISKDTVTRIELDLTADRDARIDIEIARRRQRHLHKQQSAPAAPPQLEIRAGHIQLRMQQGDRLAIEARFPTVKDTSAERLRRALRRRPFRPKLWGVSSPVPCEWLFSGVPFQVGLLAVPDAATPLLQGLDQLAIEPELRAILETFRLDFQPPLVFVANDGGNSARFVRGNELSVDRLYWLLAERDEANRFSGLPVVGEVGPFTCYRLDPAQRRAAYELNRLGYTVRHGLSVAIAGAPPLDGSSAVPRFVVGDDRLVVPTSDHSVGVQVDLGSESIEIDGRLVRVRVPEGEHILEITSQDTSRREPFRGVRAAEGESHRICWVDLSADERTVQGLLGGSIALRVDGVAPLDGLELTVELEIGVWRAGTTVSLAPLPQTLASGQEPWLTLLDQPTRQRLLQDRDPVVLHARVGCLAEDSWTLDRSILPLWWTRGSEGPYLDSELGPVRYGEISIARPAERPVPILSGDRSDAILLAPLEPDELTFGPAAGFATFCTAPDKAALAAPRMERPRLRRARSGHSGSVGMQGLVEAWLRWSVSDSDNFMADLRRQQAARQLDLWIAEVACGEVWAQREADMRTQSADPWRLLEQECLRSGRGLDELANTTEKNEVKVVRLALARICRDQPDFWVRIGQSTSRDPHSRNLLLRDGDYAELDAAFANAYGELATEYRRAGKNQIAELLDSADPGSAPDEWDAILEASLAMSELRPLAQLLLPTNTARSLVSLDLTLMPVVEITEELSTWARESQMALVGELPSEQALKAILALWIAPASAVRMDWRPALDALVTERCVARAARYLALRVRSIRHEEAAG